MHRNSSDQTAASKIPSALSAAQKTFFALGEASLNAANTTISLLFATYFLPEVAGLRPALAGVVLLVGRAVDALSDPLMGRFSDNNSRLGGRRRPYLLAGAVPFALFFSLLWLVPPLDGQWTRFAYYVTVYCAFTLSSTVVAIPYLALQADLANDYDERTSLNTYRIAVGNLGVIAALAFRPLADLLGGNLFLAAAGLAIPMAIAWASVYHTTKETARCEKKAGIEARPLFSLKGWTKNFSIVAAMYMFGRAALDLSQAILILYVTHWLGRTEDFELAMTVFVCSIPVVYPVAFRIAKSYDKATVFRWGAIVWMASSLFLISIQPEWPRWVFFVSMPVTLLGVSLVDISPWSMVADVSDESELKTGQRHDGFYTGVMQFVRKLGGALSVAIALGIVDAFGFSAETAPSIQARTAIRWVAGLGPAACLAAAAIVSLRFGIGRREHTRIRTQLDAESA